MTHVPFLDLRATYVELREELDEAYRRVMESGWYMLGREVEAFESEWAAYCGTRHCVGVGNALNGLEMALRGWDIGPGDEVLVPSNTYIASWLAVTRVGARPVPVEPDPVSANMDPAELSRAISTKSRAVMPVHLYGQCADMQPILKVAEAHGLKVLEDAAQAHGARYRGRCAGSLGHASAFSFYPTKNMGAYGDAGAVTTDDTDLADRLRVLRNYGSRRKYQNEVAGYNSRLDELQAAFLRVRLRHLDSWNGRRSATAGAYLQELDDVHALQLPEVPVNNDPAWHVFVVRHPRRDNLQRALTDAGVGTLIFYPIPPHLSGAYAKSAWGLGDFPIAEKIASTNLALPVGPHLTSSGFDQVVTAVCDAATRLG